MSGSAFNPQQDAIAKLITQEDHGFSLGAVLRRTIGGYALAMADSSEGAETCGIVIQANTDTFRMAIEGHIDCFTGLTTDVIYWLSPSVPGGMTTVQTVVPGEIQKPILISTSATSGYLTSLRGLIVPTGGGTGGDDIWQDGEESGMFAHVVSLINRDRKLGLYNDAGTTGFNLGRDFSGDDSNNFFLFNKAQETMALYIDDSGNTLIGDAQDPAEKLDVRGGIKLGSAIGTDNGVVQFTGSDFEGRVGNAWVSLTASGGTSLWEIDHYLQPIDDNPIRLKATSEIAAGATVKGVTVVFDNAEYNASPSMVLVCRGYHSSNHTPAGECEFGGFGIYKKDATDGDTKSIFAVSVRDGSSIAQRFAIHDTGCIYNPTGSGWVHFGNSATSSPDANIRVTGTSASESGVTPKAQIILYDRTWYNGAPSSGINVLLKWGSAAVDVFDAGGFFVSKANNDPYDYRSNLRLWARSSTALFEGITIHNTGRVGIMNTNPSVELDVTGSIKASSGISNIVFGVDSSGNVTIGSVFSITGSTGNIGKIRNLTYSWPSAHTPTSLLWNDGSGNLSWLSGFKVNSSGNITTINSVTTSWPSTQGAANSYLQNDGSGVLSWVVPASVWTDGGAYLYPTNGENVHIVAAATSGQLCLYDSTASSSGIGPSLDFYCKDTSENYTIAGRIRTSRSESTNSSGIDFCVHNGTSLQHNLSFSYNGSLSFINNLPNQYLTWGLVTGNNWSGIKGGVDGSLGFITYDIYNNNTTYGTGFHSFRITGSSGSTVSFEVGHDGTNGRATFSSSTPVGFCGVSTFDSNVMLQGLNNSVANAKAYAWINYSDARIKDSIITSPKGLADILLMSPKKYRQYNSIVVWEEENERFIHEIDGDSYVEKFGFIAQDLMTIIPEVVPALTDADKELYGIDYDQLIPIIIKAIQELNAKIPA
jgi:hypothetical protein